MINKRNQWRNNAKDRAFKINLTLDRSFRLLFGPANIAGCSVCGNDAIDDLGIYRQDGSKHEWQVLCFRCQNHDQTYKLNSVKKLNFQG